MGTASPAVTDVFQCIESIKLRRDELGSKGMAATSAERDERRRRRRRSKEADKALRQRYYDVLQRKDGRSSLSERIKTLRKMVLSQGLPGDSEQFGGPLPRLPGARGGATGEIPNADDVATPTGDPAENHCSLRGLVWKIMLGTIHTDAVLYTKLVGMGPSSEDVKIREDTFRTFHGDQEFRRRVNEDKLSRINNAFVRLNSPGGAVGGRGREKAVSKHCVEEGRDVRGATDGVGSKGEEDWDIDDSSARSRTGSCGGVGDTGGFAKAGGVEDKLVGGKGLYVQGMMVLCAPLLFVMPEVDAFFCFNSLLNQHMPRYVAANLDGVHAGCALVDRVLSTVDPVLFNYLESKFLTANIYAFPLVMSLHACIPPLEEAVKLWDAVFSFGVHLEVLICVAQCVALRGTLLQDPNPYQHLNARNLPPLDAELLVSMAFSLIPHLPAELMDEIAQHPFAEEANDPEAGEATS